jgi:phage gpG-like protein
MPGTRRLSSSALVEFEWIPDPIVYQAKVFAVADALEDRTVPILYSRQKVQADIREHFITETAPDGTPWDEWADSYEPFAEAFPNAGILRQTDELYELATASSAFIVSNDTLFYDAGHMPERGIWHQEGRAARTTATGSHNPLPARPFLGLSDEAEVAIYAFFQDWFDRAVDLYVTTRGRIGARHARRSEVTGQFIPNF